MRSRGFFKHSGTLSPRSGRPRRPAVRGTRESRRRGEDRKGRGDRPVGPEVLGTSKVHGCVGRQERRNRVRQQETRRRKARVKCLPAQMSTKRARHPISSRPQPGSSLLPFEEGIRFLIRFPSLPRGWFSRYSSFPLFVFPFPEHPAESLSLCSPCRGRCEHDRRETDVLQGGESPSLGKAPAMLARCRQPKTVRFSSPDPKRSCSRPPKGAACQICGLPRPSGGLPLVPSVFRGQPKSLYFPPRSGKLGSAAPSARNLPLRRLPRPGRRRPLAGAPSARRRPCTAADPAGHRPVNVP